MEGEELKEGLSNLSDTELTDKIARLKKSLFSNIGVRLPMEEDELEWRKRVGSGQSTFAVWFLNRLEAEAESKPANAFQEEIHEEPYKSPVDKGEQVLNVDLKGWDPSTRSTENIASFFVEKSVKAAPVNSEI
uniref:Uncharacterized protein n=1 Tax=Solanum lycopersicum TaxID=4081 RepID=A0A3Q7FZU7_SOLLC